LLYQAAEGLNAMTPITQQVSSLESVQIEKSQEYELHFTATTWKKCSSYTIDNKFSKYILYDFPYLTGNNNNNNNNNTAYISG
jgi:hypothetical protein